MWSQEVWPGLALATRMLTLATAEVHASARTKTSTTDDEVPRPDSTGKPTRVPEDRSASDREQAITRAQGAPSTPFAVPRHACYKLWLASWTKLYVDAQSSIRRDELAEEPCKHGDVPKATSNSASNCVSFESSAGSNRSKCAA